MAKKTKLVTKAAKKILKGEGVPQTQIKKNSLDIKEMIAYYNAEFSAAQQSRADYIDNQLKWYKKRYGIRAKKTFPWAGASNLHLPLQDKTVRKLKPEYVSVAYNTMPMCVLDGVGGEDAVQEADRANKASWHFDWLLRTRMDVFADTVMMADKTLSRGFCIVKVIYDYKTEPRFYSISREDILNAHPDGFEMLDPANMEEFYSILASIGGFDPEDPDDVQKMAEIVLSLQSGAEEVEFSVDEIVYDAPRWIVLDPEDITIPSGTNSVFDLEEASWIDHQYDVTIDELIADMYSGKFKKSTVEEILQIKGIDVDYVNDWKKRQEISAKSKGRSIIDTEKDAREGVNSEVAMNIVTIHEVCVWYDSDGDGKPERHILNYCEDYMDEDLRFIRYPYTYQMCWPYVKVPNEIIDKRHYSPRGIIELLNPLAVALNVQHNQKINRQTLNTAIMFWYVPGKVNPKNINFITGQGIPVAAAPGNQYFGTFAPNTGNESNFEREEQILKSWAEEYTSSPDFGIASVNNPMGTSRARTATEISQIGDSRMNTRNLDIDIWKQALKRIYERTWSLWQEFGKEEEISIKMNDEPITMSKDELQGKYNFVPNGRVGTTDPVLEAQKAARRFDIFKGDVYFDQYALREDYLRKDDPRLLKRLLVPREIVGQNLAAQDLMQKTQGKEGSPPAPQPITGQRTGI